MKPIALYRTAAILFVVFAAGHTIGFLKFRPPTPEGLGVLEAMNHVQFEVKGSRFTYGGFYTGFGFFATLYLLFSAFLAWHLGNMAREHPQAIGALGWVFAGVQVASLILSWKYFLAPPVVLSGLLAVCLGWASWLVRVKT